MIKNDEILKPTEFLEVTQYANEKLEDALLNIVHNFKEKHSAELVAKALINILTIRMFNLIASCTTCSGDARELMARLNCLFEDFIKNNKSAYWPESKAEGERGKNGKK